MPEKKTIERAKKAQRRGKSPSTQSGEFVREEMHDIREGKRRCPIDQAGDRHRSLKGASSRRRFTAGCKTQANPKETAEKNPARARKTGGESQTIGS